ncbi:hypothetical protein [Nocardia stercoris]|nr:hypothetical protein [Nocardia stercoris]
MNRLTADDDLFVKLHHMYPNLLATQVAWVFDEPLPREFWQKFTDHLAHGFVARRVRKTRIPFARPWFDQLQIPIIVNEDTEPVPADGYLDWLWQKGDFEVDPYNGVIANVCIAPTTDGGQIVTYVVSHIIADGGAGLRALKDAIARFDADLPVSYEESSGKQVGTTPDSKLVEVRGHLVDAGRQLRAAGIGLGRAWKARHVTGKPRNPRPAEPRLHFDGEWTPASVILEVPVADVERIAEQRGGTVNGVMVALCTGLLGRSGRVTEGTKVRVEVPHALRSGDGDASANNTTALPIQVTYRSGGKIDLVEIRDAIRTAGQAYKDPSRTPPIQHLQPIQMMLPLPVLRYLSRTAKNPEALVSNMGEVIQSVSTIGGVKARIVVGRPRLGLAPVDLYRSLEAGVNLFTGNDGKTMMLNINGCDPDRFPTRESLQKMIVDEFNDWGLTPNFWGC